MKVSKRMLRTVRGSKRVFALFELSVREWRGKLGLDGWTIVVEHRDDVPEMASCVADPTYKKATLVVNTKRMLKDKYTSLQIESVAVHEMVHALLWLAFNELANPSLPSAVQSHFEERTTEKVTSALLRAKYDNHPAVQALWTDYVVVAA